MTVKQLKKNIQQGLISHDFMIFMWEDNTFLVKDYVSQIANDLMAQVVPISKLQGSNHNALSLVFTANKDLKILEIETFAQDLPDYSIFEDTIVICKKLDKKIKDKVVDFVVKFPKLLSWQVADYVRTLCPQIPEDELTWLWTACNEDIYRVLNQVDKIRMFPQHKHREILAALKNDAATDLFNLSAFDLSEAIIKADIKTVLGFLHHRDCVYVQPLALVALLLNNYKKIAMVVLNSGITAEVMGISMKQYNAIKYYYRGYTQEQLQFIIQFLTAIDFKLKNGELELNKDAFIDYIIVNVFQAFA